MLRHSSISFFISRRSLLPYVLRPVANLSSQVSAYFLNYSMTYSNLTWMKNEFLSRGIYSRSCFICLYNLILLSMKKVELYFSSILSTFRIFLGSQRLLFCWSCHICLKLLILSFVLLKITLISKTTWVITGLFMT